MYFRHAALTLMRATGLAILSICLAGPSVSTAGVLGGQADIAVESSLYLEPISSAVNVPWGIGVLPNGDLLVTERNGQLYRIEPSGDVVEITGLPAVWSKGQGGLLDVVVHPDFHREPWVYFSYSKPVGGGSQTAIARAILRGNALTDWADLYVGDNPSKKKQHFGSRIVLQDGYVFFTVGDRGERDINPQDLSRDGGKVYRLHEDGRVPKDNPFSGSPSAMPAIWSYGHRNPQGLVFERESGKLWLHEHGPKGGDELNLVKSGANYGWPLVTFGINYWGTRITKNTALDGMESPAWHWTPSIAPSGMAVVDGSHYPSLGEGLLVGSLKFGELHFRPSSPSDAPMRVVLRGLNRVRSLAAGSDGTIYVGITGEGVFRLLQR